MTRQIKTEIYRRRLLVLLDTIKLNFHHSSMQQQTKNFSIDCLKNFSINLMTMVTHQNIKIFVYTKKHF